MKANVAKVLEENYRLVNPLKGDKIFLALDTFTNELVVIKFLQKTGLPFAMLRDNPHPLFAKIFLFAEDTEAGDTVIVEEYIHGENLETRLAAENFLKETEARKILLQLCDGLSFLHALGIIHRDIKPSNLILQAGGVVRLIDFDIARTFKSGKSKDTNFLGTTGYAAPEQFGGEQTDSRSDIFSLGKTIFELLGGKCGKPLEKILLKCMELDKKNRWQSAAELKAALTEKNYTPLKICAIVAALAAGFFFAQEQASVEQIAPAVEESASESQLSLGGLKLGDSLERMRKILGREDRLTPSESPGSSHYEYKKIVVTMNGGEIIGLVSYTDEVQTDRNIRQGSTLDEVIEAYGRRACVYENDGLTFYEYPYESARGNLAVLRFAVDKNVVEYISLRFAADAERNWLLENVRTI